MFTDAFGKKYFLSDERHGAGVRCLRENVTSENFVLWKSNKKVLQCQRISEVCGKVCREIGREVTALSQKRDSRRTRRPLSFGDGALQELSERLAERKDPSESVVGEIGAGRFHVGAFATDLYHADDAIAAENLRADNFLDDFRGFGGEFNALENAGVPNGGEIIDDFGAAFAGGARGERGFAGEGNEADILEHFWNDEVQMPPAMGDAEDSHFIGANRKRLGDAFRNRDERNLPLIAGFGLQRVGETSQFSDEIHVLFRNCAALLAAR